ncbi:MAG: hypothetical protein WBO10_12450 [Pyrinomonadaceae bacterium]
MTVFEDLITELKEANLLEETVIDHQIERSSRSFETDEAIDTGYDETTYVETESFNDSPLPVDDSPDAEPMILDSAADSAQFAQQHPEQNARPSTGKDFFRKRAVSEVSSLQMVEHVLTGVEREYLKAIPNTFDDFKAKKALNNFLHVSDGVNSEGHAAAEFELLRETEAWCSALEERDKNVPVGALRQYCENTKPALSSQALLAITRFYRNLPITETIRAKFDFVITRLFSRATENEHRICLFTREETLNHIKTLYADWSSIPLYSASDDDSNVMLASLSFEDLAVEAENASNFDQLIQNDFFGRLRTFKESLSEIFLAPVVTAAAVEANVRIGNAYVTLISREREKMDADSIQAKYGSQNDLAIADATGRTLDLEDILKAPVRPVERPEPEPEEDIHERQEVFEPVQQETTVSSFRRSPLDLVYGIRDQVLNFNKWVLAFCAVMLLAAGGLVLYSNLVTEPKVTTAGVSLVEFDKPLITEHVTKAKVSGTTLYVQLEATWNVLPKTKREEILQAILAYGPAKGFTAVSLIRNDGRSGGFASGTRVEVEMP